MPAAWWSRTGQTWKIFVFLGLTVVTLILFATFISVGVNGEPPRLWIGPLFIAWATASFAWFFTTIRCGNCRGRVAWQIVKKVDVSSWFVQIYALERCPICGHDGKRR
jgi:hypothetical protein